MLETRLFDFNGFNNRRSYYKNKGKQLFGKGLNNIQILTRRKQLIEYYKKNPNELKSKDKAESNESLLRKLKDKRSGAIVARKFNKLNSSIRSTGSKYIPGKATKTAIKISTPLLAAPIPGTTAAAAIPITAAAAYDKTKMSLLRRNEGVKKADDDLKKLKKDIKLDEKIQKLQKQKLKLK